MFFDFLKNHYELIGSVILVLLSFILTLVKKKPVLNKIDAIKTFILSSLPSLINQVEKPGQGSTKKETVLKTIMVLCLKHFQYFDDDLKSFTSQAIQDILSTPQDHKKEV